MTKADIIKILADQVGLTRREAAEVLSVVLDGVVGAIRAGEKVELRGFGSFRTRKRQARAGRNPRTGAQVHVPPKVVPYFKPGKQLREVLGGE
ncbi:MAG: integration host factor subunit beta [Thermoanaerobaculaceae bacterium]|jgi:integration host factor subunit beta|nr:integration host factor subunit beta [Thermoanaerobaculaceae bacterium]HLE60537.1 HU family DNA-binding protein [Thermoanaerobaculaceae bacterium]HVN32044.1 HU family DNA-binding protein [Thermoanaerobaculaceae bacterium]